MTLGGNSSRSALDRVVAALEGRGSRRSGKNYQCPAHDDATASLSLTEADGKALLHCHAGCQNDDVVAALGLTLADLFDETREHKSLPPVKNSANGKAPAPTTLADLAAAKKLPIDYLIKHGCTDVATPYPHVDIPWRGPDGAVAAIQSRPGPSDRFKFRKGDSAPLYGAHVLDKVRARGWTLLVEGATDCWTAWRHGIPALGLPSASTWRDEWTEQLAGVDVVWWQEDAAGAKLTPKLASTIPGLRVITEAGYKDLSDAYIAGVDVKALVGRLRENAPLAIQPARPAGPVRPLGEVLDAVERFITRFVCLTNKAQTAAIVLWAAHTHGLEAFAASPFLAITSPEPESGKTRTFEILELVVAKPWRVTQPSEAVLFRKIDKDQPTLLLDEVDAIFSPKAGGNTEGLRGLLNASNRRGTTVPRTTGKGFELVDFAIFSPKALAGIGRLPVTITSRSIPIRLQRRKRDEVIERFRYRTASEDGHALRDDLAAVMAEHLDDLAGNYPDVPDELGDRAADSWEPLIAIADAAGGTWPRRARDAAVTLSGTNDAVEQSLSIKLLDDIRSLIVPDAKDHVAILDDFIPTKQLLEKLKANDEWPWGDVHEVNLSARKLGILLKKYAIKPTTARPGPGTAPIKGYHRQAFVTVAERYLDPVSLVPLEPVTPVTTADPELNTATPLVTGVTGSTLFSEPEKEEAMPDGNSVDVPCGVCGAPAVVDLGGYQICAKPSCRAVALHQKLADSQEHRHHHHPPT